MMLNVFTKKIKLVTYRTYGSVKFVYLKGNCKYKSQDNILNKNIFKMNLYTWTLFKSKKIKDLLIEIKFSKKRKITTRTNQDGAFFVSAKNLLSNKITTNKDWIPFNIQVLNSRSTFKVFKGEMLIPSEDASFGVISDIDDTILKTGVTSFLKIKLFYNTFFKKPGSREEIPEASRFLNLLKGEEAKNPFFYVSNSPFSLYEYLDTFLALYNFPKGAILLRDIRSSKVEPLFVRNQEHKFKEISNIFKTYPNMKFILIGDTAELDFKVFSDLYESYPSNIKQIYMREVKQGRHLNYIRDYFKINGNIPVCLFNSVNKVITHARDNGFLK